MFHIPAHRSTTAAQVAIADRPVDCPRCGGGVEYDEDGRPYTCFCCCNRGTVPLAQAYGEYESAAAAQAEHDTAFAAERARIAEYDGYDEGDEPGEYAPRRSWPRNPSTVDMDDDIPF